MTSELLLIPDVSNYQPVTQVPWADPRIAGGYVKFSEAAGQMSLAPRHCSAIKAAGKPFGGYHFFHPDDPVIEQFQAFDYCAAHVGYGAPEHLVPAVDVEYFKGHGVGLSWVDPLQELCDALEQAYGCKPMLYLNAPTWQLLGKPAWILDHPLWVPWFSVEGHEQPDHLPANLVPGGGAWTMWQRLGGKMFGHVQCQAGGVDQNWATRLPTIGGP